MNWSGCVNRPLRRRTNEISRTQWLRAFRFNAIGSSTWRHGRLRLLADLVVRHSECALSDPMTDVPIHHSE